MNSGFKLPTAIISNGVGVNGWQDASNIFLVDNLFATASGLTNILIVGNFNNNIPQDSLITNITVRVKGYRGTFNTTLQIFAVDNTTGVEFSYPMLPTFQGFSGTNTLYTLPSTLFATTWTVDQINNIKLKLIADGELHIDSIEVDVQFQSAIVPPPPTPVTGLLVCDEFVQAQPFQLAQSLSATDLFAFLKNMNYPDTTTPIQYSDFHGDALLVIDQGVPGKEETVRITNIEQDYNNSGMTRLSFTTITNRGLKFQYPYDHDINLVLDHNGTAEMVASNPAAFYDRFIKKCQIDALVSAPIIVFDENSPLPVPAHDLDFRGAGVTAINDGGDPFHKIITIPGAGGTTPPQIVSTTSNTSGNIQVTTLSALLQISGLDRGVVIQVSTEEAQTITSILVGGVPATQQVVQTDVPNNLRSEIWFVANPPLGPQNVVVNLSGAAYLTFGAECVNGIDSVTPIGNTQNAAGNSNNPTLLLVTGTDYSIVIDSLVTALLPIVYTAGAGQGVNWSITANPTVRQGASSVESAGTQPDNITMDWAMTQSTDWCLTAIEIKGITSTVIANPLEVDDEGVPVELNTTKMNFVGAGVTVTPGAPGEVIVTIPAGGGGGGNYVVDQTPDNGTYGLLAGAVDGINTQYTVSQSAYVSGSLMVFLNGLAQLQGAADDWQETAPAAGTFDFNTAPLPGDIITVIYQTANTIAQVGIQFEDEGVNLGTPGTVDEVDFVGPGVGAVRAGNKVTVTIPGGGSGGFMAQQIPLIDGNFTVDPLFITSDQSGSVIYITYISATNTTLANILRLLKDPTTGSYYVTHSTTLAVNANSVRGLAVAGGFLYVVAVIGGNSSMRRYSDADLTGVTVMTGLTAGDSRNMWSDGTDLFICTAAGDSFERYTIAATVLTDTGPVAFTTSGNPSTGSISDGTNVWVTDLSGSGTCNVRKYLVAGGAPISTISLPLFPNAYPGDTGDVNLFLGASNILGIGWGFNMTSQAAVTGIATNLLGITLP